MKCGREIDEINFSVTFKNGKVIGHDPKCKQSKSCPVCDPNNEGGDSAAYTVQFRDVDLLGLSWIFRKTNFQLRLNIKDHYPDAACFITAHLHDDRPEQEARISQFMFTKQKIPLTNVWYGVTPDRVDKLSVEVKFIENGMEEAKDCLRNAGFFVGLIPTYHSG